jgi:hypothetical protein
MRSQHLHPVIARMLVLALMRVFAHKAFLALGMSARRNKRPVRLWYMSSPAIAENGAAGAERGVFCGHAFAFSNGNSHVNQRVRVGVSMV